MTATMTTLRPQATDAHTELRRLVADSIVEATDARGMRTADWLAGVERLRQAVSRLDQIRAEGGPQRERSVAADAASLALLSIISVYDDARARLDARLEGRADLAQLRVELGQDSSDIMDPVLHGQLAEQVCRFLEARSPQLVVTL